LYRSLDRSKNGVNNISEYFPAIMWIFGKDWLRKLYRKFHFFRFLNKKSRNTVFWWTRKFNLFRKICKLAHFVKIYENLFIFCVKILHSTRLIIVKTFFFLRKVKFEFGEQEIGKLNENLISKIIKNRNFGQNPGFLKVLIFRPDFPKAKLGQ